MDEDKSISASNIPLFSKKWAREYWGSLLFLITWFIFLIYSGWLIISGYLNPQPDHKVLQGVVLALWSVGQAVSSLDNWVKKEYPQRYFAVVGTALLIQGFGFFLLMLSAFMSIYPDLTIHWTFYP